ncbi:ABC transporter permease [Sulfurimonas sp. MAG313]|nr:ABC transporter permease [Sulfurimonas sp. MAG313]MDF1882186.1 ABC transporter permease [Sulfurimonas sp. MAG313]
MRAFIEGIGRTAIKVFFIFSEALYFTYQCLVKMFFLKSYNSATRDILIKQIYFTAVQALPILSFIGIVFGSIIIGLIVQLALDYALKDHIGDILIILVFSEFAPLMTVLFLALRSGAAINTEIAVMKVSKELNTLKAFNIDIIEYLFLPRIMAGVISTILLASFLSIIMLISGYIYLLLFFETGLELYVRTLIHAVSINDFIWFFIKSFLFGFFVTLIPIYSGLNSSQSYTGIPIAVLNGMVKLIIAIMSIEGIILIIQYV